MTPPINLGILASSLSGFEATYDLLTTVTPNNVTSFSLNNISQDYTHLYWDASYYGNQAYPNQVSTRIRINNISSNSYGSVRVTQSSDSYEVGINEIRTGMSLTTTNAATYGAPAAITKERGFLPFYSATDRKKVLITQGLGYSGVFGMSDTNKLFHSVVNTNSAVTQINFFLSNNSFRYANYTEVKLYGVKA